MTVTSEPANQPRAGRERMRRIRRGETTSFEIGGAEFYLTANPYEDGRLGEIFAKFGKEGSTIAGLMDAISILVSLAVQHGVPLETIIGKLTNTRYEPMGMTDDPDIPEASSVMDYVCRRLALDFLPPDKRAQLGVFSADEEARALISGESLPAAPQPAWRQ